MTLNGEKLKIIASKIRNKTECSFLLFLFNILLKVFATVIRRERNKEREKPKYLSLFAYDTILYLKDLNDSTRKFISKKYSQQSSSLQNQDTEEISNLSIY